MQDKSKIKTEFDKSILYAIDRKTPAFLYSEKEAIDTLLIWPDAHVVATSMMPQNSTVWYKKFSIKIQLKDTFFLHLQIMAALQFLECSP